MMVDGIFREDCFHSLRTRLIRAVWCLLVVATPASMFAQENKTKIELSHLQSLDLPALAGVNRFAMSSDGKFLYAAPWKGAAIVVFEIENDGQVAFLENVENPLLQGVIKLDLNADESRLAAICMRSTTILLFKRDGESGKLTPGGFSRTDLVFPVSVQFSADSKFLYVGDARASGGRGQSQLVVYRVGETGGLEKVQSLQHPDMNGMRDLVLSADGKNCYATCSDGSCILSCKRDEETGELEVVQVIKDDEEEATLLEGIHSPVISEDGKRLYAISGRFRGDNGVTVFGREEDGTLRFINELPIDDPAFGGGNHLAVTKDQRLIIVSGTTGNSLAIVRQNLEENELELDRLVMHDPQQQNVEGASGLVFSPDEKYLYVAAENGNAVTVFELSPASDE